MMSTRLAVLGVAALLAILIAGACGKKAVGPAALEPPAGPVAEAPQGEQAQQPAPEASAPGTEATEGSAGEIEHVSSAEEFARIVLDSDLPVLVDFWAEWCGPCQMIAPVLESIAEKYAGKLRVVKVNVDEARELADRYKVTAIPTLLFVSNGKVVHKSVGYMDESELDRMVQKYLLAGK